MSQATVACVGDTRCATQTANRSSKLPNLTSDQSRAALTRAAAARSGVPPRSRPDWGPWQVNTGA